jgi:predicted SAM-dependent methyltransferase
MKINLASGQRPFKKPWINVDIRHQGYDIDIEADVKELPFEDESCDILVAHHLWEHIPLEQQEETIREWYRVLKKGGILSIHIPNMKELCKAWLEGRINTYIFNVNTYGAFQGYVTDLHRWSYDEKELEDRVKCWNGSVYKFDFEYRNYNKFNSLYLGSDIAEDWWILSKEFVKR